MNANPVLLQKKYVRIIQGLQEAAGITTEEALRLFYESRTYQLVSRGVSDMHARSDAYLVDELLLEHPELGCDIDAAPSSRAW